jgi:hypothetical protein
MSEFVRHVYLATCYTPEVVLEIDVVDVLPDRGCSGDLAAVNGLIYVYVCEGVTSSTKRWLAWATYSAGQVRKR